MSPPDVAIAESVLPIAQAKTDKPSNGLSSDEATVRLKTDGLNAMPDGSVRPIINLLSKFWAPIPWLLEGALILEVTLHKYFEAAIIAGLLIFNASLAFVQEGRAEATLKALRSRLALSASVLRDGKWQILPATQLVRGDLVKLSLGTVVAADVRLVGGSVLLDQSMLTGESLPTEAGTGADTYAGALVQRGEATAEVTSTGGRTKFGRTAELVQTAHSISSQQTAVLQIVRNLAIFNGGVIVLMGLFAYSHSLPRGEIISLLLTSVLAAIPVGLPATFTLAAALGARALAKLGVLPTRLSAVDEAGTINVLCSDKTGTLTLNQLSVTTVRALSGSDEAHVLAMASLASSDGGADGVDAAIRSASETKPPPDPLKLSAFVPFDPAKKTSEATALNAKGDVVRIVKGAFTAVAGLTAAAPDAAAIADQLERKGFRVLAVAAGPSAALEIIGLIALSDPPRPDSVALVAELKSLGVRTVMVTGDASETAAIVARAVGLDDTVCPPGALPDNIKPQDFAIFASILPEGKFDLVKAFQKGGHAVGMCGDGANDAPALRQAQIGIAVSTATDVAKSAAGVVLTEAGLGGIVAAVKVGRTTFQRILSYTLRSTIKKVAQILLLAIGLVMTGQAVLTPMLMVIIMISGDFLAIGLVMTGQAVLTPMLMVIIMISGDFLSMSLATDRVRPSETPNSWEIGKITIAGLILGTCFLAFCTGILAFGKFEMHYGINTLRTLTAIALVYGSQAITYAVRDRRHFWDLQPTKWLVLSTCADLLFISVLANRGIAMARLSLAVLATILGASVVFWMVLNIVKIPTFTKLKLS
jgi:H+-transporting ATPase